MKNVGDFLVSEDCVCMSMGVYIHIYVYTHIQCVSLFCI